ncbi:MAG: hypothetical protein LIP01_15640 [Tannerellaceae bacterium]|nr:hypothetical protein [Tannerellaceae bacterium]
MANTRIMSWSECDIKIGKTGANEAMATDLKSIGTIKDKSTTLESAEGEVLEAKATGGKMIARQELDGTITLTTRVIEPEFEFLSGILNSVLNEDKDELKVNSLVVPEDFSVQVTPQNVGATGVRIRKASLAYKEGYSEEEGMYADLTFTVLACADGELYTKFKKNVMETPEPDPEIDLTDETGQEPDNEGIQNGEND